MLAQRIEQAALNAWPAAEEEVLDGWLLRFTNGYTKRANSINPLGESLLDGTEKIETCERIYGERGLPAIFRLTSFRGDAVLDRLLEARGYAVIDPTLVLALDIDDGAGRETSGPGPILYELDRWLDAFYTISRLPVEQRRDHEAILKGIRGERLLAVVEKEGEDAACGMAVLENGLCGVFDMVTAPGKRNMGLGTRVLSGLLQRARGGGAHLAYLQVVRANAPARRLYARFGFRDVYHYWYRVPGRR
jgi:GNAT superfamily N-acetyltransferase